MMKIGLPQKSISTLPGSLDEVIRASIVAHILPLFLYKFITSPILIINTYCQHSNYLHIYIVSVLLV